jgi:hypothetical protein
MRQRRFRIENPFARLGQAANPAVSLFVLIAFGVIFWALARFPARARPA